MRRADTPRPRTGRVLACTLALLYSLAAPGYARQGGGATLDSIDSLLARGSYSEARTMLQSWWQSAEGGNAPSAEQRARALFLRARLHTDPRAAEEDYLTLALAHPAAPQAPAALLALGQGLLAAGELQRAATYLERLARDYPSSQLRPVALLWLARVNLAAERPNAACTSARQGGEAARSPELITLLRAEADEACRAAATGGADKPFPPVAQRQTDQSPQGQSEQAQPPPAQSSPTQRPPEGAAAATDRRFTLQVGAFREQAGAKALAARLREAGFEPRIVVVPGNSLRRVRIGVFQNAAEANAMARRVRAAGFEVVVTSDVAVERPVS